MMPYKELNEKQIDKEIKKYGVNRDLWNQEHIQLLCLYQFVIIILLRKAYYETY